MPKISQYEEKMEELTKAIRFETDNDALKRYIVEYLRYYIQIRIKQDEIDQLSVVLN